MPENNTEENFLLQHGYEMYFNPAENAKVDDDGWMNAGEGVTDMDQNGNDEVDTSFYYANKGYGESDVVGGQLVLGFTGHRKYKNQFLDLLFNNLRFSIGKKRKGTYRLVFPDGGYLINNCTLAEIEGPGGAANSKGEISYEVRLNGQPFFVDPEETPEEPEQPEQD